MISEFPPMTPEEVNETIESLKRRDNGKGHPMIVSCPICEFKNGYKDEQYVVIEMFLGHLIDTHKLDELKESLKED